MNILRRDLLLQLLFLRSELLPHLRLVLVNPYKMGLQPVDQRVAELRVVLLHALLLRVLPHL